MSAMGRQQPGSMAYGFSGGLAHASASRSKVVMMATDKEVTAETSESESLINKGKTQAEINAEKFKPGYAYFVLFITLCARIMVQW